MYVCHAFIHFTSIIKAITKFTFQTMTKSLILYPHSSASTILAMGLLREGHNVFLYAPEEINLRMAYTIPTDLKIEASTFNTSVETLTDLKLLNKMDYIVIPSLDVCPLKPREEFAKMCHATFRYKGQIHFCFLR